MLGPACGPVAHRDRDDAGAREVIEIPPRGHAADPGRARDVDRRDIVDRVAERAHHECEGGRREALRKRRAWLRAKETVDAVDLALVELAGLGELRAESGIAFELLAERRELERFHQVVQHTALKRVPERLDVPRRGDRDDIDWVAPGRVKCAEHLEP